MTTQPVQPGQPPADQQEDEDKEKHWGDEGVTIDQIPDDEREALLKQAGTMGEMARVAWQQYQEGQPQPEEAGAVEKERQRLQEMGQPVDAPPAGATSAVATDVIDTPEEEAAETGTESEREAAERKAAERNLEIRDFGTAGDWRVYDPATGRQVAKSRLDDPVPTAP